MLGEPLTLLAVLLVDLVFVVLTARWCSRLIRDHEAPGFPPTAAVVVPFLYLVLFLLLSVAAAAPQEYGAASSEGQHAFGMLIHWPVVRVIRLLAYPGARGGAKLLGRWSIVLSGVCFYFLAGLVVALPLRLLGGRKG